MKRRKEEEHNVEKIYFYMGKLIRFPSSDEVSYPKRCTCTLPHFLPHFFKSSANYVSNCETHECFTSLTIKNLKEKKKKMVRRFVA